MVSHTDCLRTVNRHAYVMAATKYVAGFTYTNAELLALYRECAARISVSGQEYELNGRRYTAADAQEVRQTIDWLQTKVDAESGPLFGTLLARMVSP